MVDHGLGASMGPGASLFEKAEDENLGDTSHAGDKSGWVLAPLVGVSVMAVSVFAVYDGPD